MILLRYNEQPIPDWNYGLTINGVVSVLAGIAKASMILPVAESISQLKWHWFSTGKPRPVIDFEHLDTASRGPWGCLMMLCRPRQWSVVSLGAFITVTALMMEPSLQFIPSYPSRLTTGGHALIPTATLYKDVNYGTTVDPYSYGSTKGKFVDGFLIMASDSSQTPIPSALQLKTLCIKSSTAWRTIQVRLLDQHASRVTVRGPRSPP